MAWALPSSVWLWGCPLLDSPRCGNDRGKAEGEGGTEIGCLPDACEDPRVFDDVEEYLILLVESPGVVAAGLSFSLLSPWGAAVG